VCPHSVQGIVTVDAGSMVWGGYVDWHTPFIPEESGALSRRGKLAPPHSGLVVQAARTFTQLPFFLDELENEATITIRLSGPSLDSLAIPRLQPLSNSPW